MLIRVEIPVDAPLIDQLLSHDACFGEAAMLHQLREDGLLTLGMVACEDDGQLSGYLAFSPVTLAGEDRQWVALVALAVANNCRGRGIASRLIEEGFNSLNEFGYQAVLVSSGSEFYRQFGFVDAAGYGLRCHLPDLQVFALAEEALAEKALADVQGLVEYPALFLPD